MRALRLQPFFLCLVFCATLSRLFGAGAGSASPSAHTWMLISEWQPDRSISNIAPRSIEYSELRLQMGDDSRWAAAEWDDGAWQTIRRTAVPADTGIFWLRLRVRTQTDTEKIPLMIVTSGRSVREAYWDGVWIGASGTPGNGPEEQVEGSNRLMFELPFKMTTAGEHVVALRMSTYGVATVRPNPVVFHLWVLPSDAFWALRQNMTFLSALGIGSMLTVGIAVFVMWLVADRRLILGLFSALCFSAAFLITTAGALDIWTIPVSIGPVLSIVRMALVVTVAGLLAGIAMVQLYPALHRGWLAAPFLLVGTTALYCYFNATRMAPAVLWRIAFIGVVILCAYGALRRREGAWLILTGMALTFWLFERDTKHFAHSRFVIAFLPIVVGLIAAIALQLRRERLEARDAKLTAARLEIELLKKSLQPHFLMNTLTALSEVIEEKPAAAVRLIDDLALELRSLGRFSGEKRVSLAEEIALCRAHLGVMSARTDLAWKLDAAGIDTTASVPPALFLTLIENGFSHQRARKDATTFTLRCERMRDGVRYIFLSPGTVTSGANRVMGGTGLRYICARLEESFHDAWKLHQGIVGDGWETVIELRDSAVPDRTA